MTPEHREAEGRDEEADLAMCKAPMNAHAFIIGDIGKHYILALHTCRKERDETRAEVERLRAALVEARDYANNEDLPEEAACLRVAEVIDTALLPSAPSAKEAPQ